MSQKKSKDTKAKNKKDNKDTKATDKKNKKNKKKGNVIGKRVYEKELFKLQLELVKLQAWVQHKGLKVVVVFEGRDAAGKGGVIKRITQHLSPRIARVVALPAPT